VLLGGGLGEKCPFVKNQFYEKNVGQGGTGKGTKGGDGLVVIEYKKPGAHWSYDGEYGSTRDWEQYFSSQNRMGKCDGRRQSPIVLFEHGAKKRAFKKLAVTFRPVKKATVKNTGYGVNLIGKDLNGITIKWKGLAYTLDRIEFHRKSEHLLGFHDPSPLEAQLYFKTKSDVVALAVLFELDKSNKENDFLDQMKWFALPAGTDDSTPVYNLNLKELLAPVLGHPYYDYRGSLTIPPCTENVQWIVFKKMATISAHQAAIFPFISNSRPVQHKHGRRFTLSS